MSQRSGVAPFVCADNTQLKQIRFITWERISLVNWLALTRTTCTDFIFATLVLVFMSAKRNFFHKSTSDVLKLRTIWIQNSKRRPSCWFHEGTQGPKSQYRSKTLTGKLMQFPLRHLVTQSQYRTGQGLFWNRYMSVHQAWQTFSEPKDPCRTNWTWTGICCKEIFPHAQFFLYSGCPLLPWSLVISIQADTFNVSCLKPGTQGLTLDHRWSKIPHLSLGCSCTVCLCTLASQFKF